MNYLIDEAVDTGKGGNTVVSMLHHFLETHTLIVRNIHLHADNCVGQNKNNTVMHGKHNKKDNEVLSALHCPSLSHSQARVGHFIPLDTITV